MSFFDPKIEFSTYFFFKLQTSKKHHRQLDKLINGLKKLFQNLKSTRN
jgi:hypothetical protein